MSNGRPTGGPGPDLPALRADQVPVGRAIEVRRRVQAITVRRLGAPETVTVEPVRGRPLELPGRPGDLVLTDERGQVHLVTAANFDAESYEAV